MLLTVALRRLLIATLVMTPLLAVAAPVPLTLLPHARVDLPAFSLPDDLKPWLQQRQQIRVGVWLPAHPPYEVDNAPENLEGLIADYLSLLQSALSLPLQIQRYPDRQAALQALKSGEIDLLPTPVATVKDEPDLRHSAVWLPDHAVLVHQPGVTLNSNDELAGKTLLYIGDDALRQSLQQAWPQAKWVASRNYYSAMAAVANDDNVVLWTNALTAADINQRIYENRLVLESTRVNSDQSMVFTTRRDAEPLVNLVNEVMASLPGRMHARIAEAWRLNAPLTHARERLKLTPEQMAWVKQYPVVPVLLSNNHEPMTFLNEQGEESGFIIDLLQRIGQQTGITFTWQPFDNLVEMRAHLSQHPESLIALADASAGENDGIFYSRPYLISSWVLVTRQDAPTIRSLADMAGKTVAAYPGSYYLPTLRKQFPQVDFVEKSFSLETVFSLWTHNLDGAVLPQNAASFFLKSYLADRFKVATILSLPPLKMAMATSEQNRVLLSIINNALLDISPQAMDAQLSGWQLRFTLERLNVWGRYQNIIISSLAALVIIAMMLGFFFWRNRLLKHNLAVQEALRRELQAAKLAVEKTSESKSLFLSQMSHEIRTPMNALLGLLELENRGLSTPEQRKNNLAVAWESARSLLMLLGDILDMAKIESGKFNVRSIPLSLTDQLNSVSTLFRYSADEKNIALVTTIEVTDDVILFDPVMLKQIVSNLLSNAIKFTSHGEVEVAMYQAAKTATEHGDYVLEVCDSGIGLTPEQQKAIFEPFVQVEASRVTQKGTGLGLTICRQLGDLLGGTLEVESTPGEGSSFIFRFSAPIWQGSLEDTTEAPLATVTTPRKILVVDDHPPNRLLLSQQLAFAGHHSISAEDGEQALHIWLQEQPPFDLVITDCTMPGMSGFELVRRLRDKEREMGRTPQPMFGLTAMAEQEVKVRAQQAGMTDCLFKPLELASLLARINPVLPEVTDDVPTVLTLDKLAQSQPESFNELIHLMLTRNKQDREQLTQALLLLDHRQIQRSAHSLLGGARLINARVLAEVCQRLQAGAMTADPQQIQQWIEDCVAQIDALDAELRNLLHQPHG